MGRRLLIVVIGCFAAWWAAAPVQGQGTDVPVRSCGSVEYPDMTVRLKVRGRVSCRGSRRVALRYANKADGGNGCPPAGGNTCPLRVGSFRCHAPTSESLPLVLSCRSRRLEARIKGYKA